MCVCVCICVRTFVLYVCACVDLWSPQLLNGSSKTEQDGSVCCVCMYMYVCVCVYVHMRDYDYNILHTCSHDMLTGVNLINGYGS